MSDKTLGQVAFWRFHYERGDITVEQVEALWRGIPQSERDCWQAAAEAVVSAHLVQDPPLLNRYIALMKENTAVIEATKHYKAGWHTTTGELMEVRRDKMFAAVEALQAVEGE